MTHDFGWLESNTCLYVFVLWGNEHSLKTWTLDLLYLWCRISVCRWSDWEGYEDVSAQDDGGLSFYTSQINTHLRQEQTKTPNKAQAVCGECVRVLRHVSRLENRGRCFPCRTDQELLLERCSQTDWEFESIMSSQAFIRWLITNHYVLIGRCLCKNVFAYWFLIQVCMAWSI